MYSLGELGLRCMEERGGGERRRISCPHHKKSRNLMSNFAQHRVRSLSCALPLSLVPLSVESQKIKVSSS